MELKHVVVDGSNIATEGRSLPSLKQLDEAVRTFLAENPTEHVTVIVDATFGHRIDASERAEYEEAILAGEIVTPPAGAIGRGDKFVLQVADRANAAVLSNDSFQEFHGEYSWVFDEGRLIGGKPVPGVGWVFLLRTPVRGPASRRAVRDARAKPAAGAAAAEAGRPRRAGRRRKSTPTAAEAVVAEVSVTPAHASRSPPSTTRSRSSSSWRTTRWAAMSRARSSGSPRTGPTYGPTAPAATWASSSWATPPRAVPRTC